MNTYPTKITDVSKNPPRSENAEIRTPVIQSDIDMFSNYWCTTGNENQFNWPLIIHNLDKEERSYTLHLTATGKCTLQGLMTVSLDGKCPKSIGLSDAPENYLYGCYIEVAPWNRHNVKNRLYKYVGAKLMIFVLDFCKKNNYDGMVLDSFSYNKEFYEYFGFVEEGNSNPSRFVRGI